MLNKFNKWLKKNKAEGTSLHFKEYSDTMRGVYSSENIREGTTLMKVPINMIIHSTMVKDKSDIVKKLIKQNITFISSAHVFISIYMIETFEDPTHFFYPYYQILPSHLNNIPLFWTEEELEEFNGSVFLDLVNNKIQKLKREYDKITSNISYFKSLATFERYKYIRCLVASRNFTLHIGGEKVNAMVPWADMLNHELPAQTRWGYKDNYFFIDSLKDIKSNTEIMDSYGLKSNSTYLLHYGFTVKEETHRNEDNVTITIKSQKITLTIPFNNNILQNQLLTLFKNGRSKNKKKEKQTLYKINKSLIALLDKYNTPYKDDIKILDSGTLDPFSNKHNAMMIVSNEKKIIQHYITCIFKILEYLDLQPTDRVLNETYLVDYFESHNG